MINKMLFLVLISFVYLNSVISYPYDPVYQSDYEADHAAAVLEVDGHLAGLEYSDDGGYRKGDGGSYDDSHYSLGGEKGDKGYRSNHGYREGQAKNYGAEGHKNHYNNNGGHNSGHNDASKYYKDNHSIVKGSEGKDYAESKSYNKGSKTTGFHNVHHKEEYQKNKKFYDENQKSGHYARYGDFGKALLAAAGKTSKGSYYDSAYRNGYYGKSGFGDKGSLYSDLNKYSKANGYDGYYGNYADYGQAGKSGHNNAYGYGDYHH